MSGEELKEFYRLVERVVSGTICCNKRQDGLYHTYNTLRIDKGGMEIEHLQEMLEGQVAVLSSGLLTSGEAVEICTALRHSGMYEDRQNSYMLYPNKNLQGFWQRTASHLTEQRDWRVIWSRIWLASIISCLLPE